MMTAPGYLDFVAGGCGKLDGWIHGGTQQNGCAKVFSQTLTQVFLSRIFCAGIPAIGIVVGLRLI